MKFYKTKNNAFLVDEVQDDFREKLNIVFGYALRLHATRVFTPNNEKGILQYSNYISESPIQVCRKENVVETRDASEIETEIFNSVKNNQSLSKEQRAYLQEKFYKELDNSETSLEKNNQNEELSLDL
ncbi:hypothetical protein RON38_03430 [Lactobacillus mulieris]|uniref:hypothetical protein n=1 Tax=Lactobacillus mulieris TaxID=2508708 RepID=UPI001ADE8952|nr:hypothetical protein [Lactobacillus mulieris]MDK6803217.1 hypothetical protein [Lactobacillus mulieris]MDK8382333.1 hypothetical protein [Lactobacillus mulieris]MDT9620562.1 hypothetical protein [Lactobacillus mulieris]